MVDRIDRVDARKSSVQRGFDARGRTIRAVEDLPSTRKAALRIDERIHDLLPLLILHLIPLDPSSKPSEVARRGCRR